MPVRWYYESEAGIVGPVSAAELKYLIDVGTIGVSTLVRPGEDGPWLGVEKIAGLLAPAGEGTSADHSASQVAEWHFNLKGQNKEGPVPSSVLKAMIAAETLQPDDLVWKPGMALWIPAARVPGLLACPGDRAVQKPGFLSKLSLQARSRAVRAAAAVVVLLGLFTGAFAWRWAQSKSKDRLDTGVGAPRA